VRESRVHTVCLLVLTALGIGAALAWLKPVLVPFVLAVFVAIGLTPLIELQVKHLRLPRNLAVVTTLVLGLFGLVVLGMLISALAPWTCCHSSDSALTKRQA
jgi:AI-2 transport protein TqsA